MTDREFLIELKRALTIALRAVEAKLGDTVEVKEKGRKAA
jgi:hypothetical protein